MLGWARAPPEFECDAKSTDRRVVAGLQSLGTMVKLATQASLGGFAMCFHVFIVVDIYNGRKAFGAQPRATYSTVSTR